ncbi:hypothetical protein K490DRAFT_55166 [Saccharata proteae CBS 121410]|uniref:Uncharacterized protein n=1 Tax=Saccharata proteae CBS 121410 TaxID=1314787 RepID=A0A6A5YDI6_9PEZI|nr:hypothetical protein K490DRAFT_55166 [Saccharata proteae CBS 121410]
MFLDRFRLGKAGAKGSHKKSGSPGKEQSKSRGVESRPAPIAHPQQCVQQGNAHVNTPSTQHLHEEFQNAHDLRGITIRQVREGDPEVHLTSPPQHGLQASDSSTLPGSIEHSSTQSTPGPSSIDHPTPDTTISRHAGLSKDGSTYHDSTKAAIDAPAVYKPSSPEHLTQPTGASTTPVTYIPSVTPGPQNAKPSSLVKKTFNRAKQFLRRLRRPRKSGQSSKPSHHVSDEHITANTNSSSEQERYEMCRQMAELFCSGSTPQTSLNTRTAAAMPQATWASDNDRYRQCRQMAELFVTRTSPANNEEIQPDSGHGPTMPLTNREYALGPRVHDYTAEGRIKRWLDGVAFHQGTADEWRPEPPELDSGVEPGDGGGTSEGSECCSCCCGC